MPDHPAAPRRWGRYLLLALLFLVLLTVAAWFGGRAYLALSVFLPEGHRTVAGLAAPAQVYYDARGIPQVWAQTDADLYFVLPSEDGPGGDLARS